MKDLSGDGKVTKKDVLIGRGVIEKKKGGMVGYMVSKGIFAGISAEGAVAATAGKSNEAYYGKGTRATDILITRTASNPGSNKLRAAVTEAMQ